MTDRYTHGHAESVLRSHRTRTATDSAAYLLPHLDRSQRLLDIGSGPGTITADLAGLVGEVVAVEIGEAAAAHTAGLADVAATASTWCYATPETRAWWGGMWADRILESALAEQLVAEGRASTEDLQAISQAWRRWLADDDGWFTVLHGEILARV